MVMNSCEWDCNSMRTHIGKKLEEGTNCISWFSNKWDA
jgi:hypothetical protein